MLLNSDTQLNQRSYYEASVARPPAQPPLQGEHHADVVVMGAGYSGLSAAIELSRMPSPPLRSIAIAFSALSPKFLTANDAFSTGSVSSR